MCVQSGSRSPSTVRWVLAQPISWSFSSRRDLVQPSAVQVGDCHQSATCWATVGRLPRWVTLITSTPLVMTNFRIASPSNSARLPLGWVRSRRSHRSRHLRLTRAGGLRDQPGSVRRTLVTVSSPGAPSTPLHARSASSISASNAYASRVSLRSSARAALNISSTIGSNTNRNRAPSSASAARDEVPRAFLIGELPRVTTFFDPLVRAVPIFPLGGQTLLPHIRQRLVGAGQ